MVPTWMISMFISNTATTAIMLPITQAVLQQIEQCSNEEGMAVIASSMYT